MQSPCRSRNPLLFRLAIGLLGVPAAAFAAPEPEMAAGPDTALATVGPRVLGPAEFRRQWDLSAAQVLSPETPPEEWKPIFLEALIERDLLTLAALDAGFAPTGEQEAYLGAVRLIETRLAYYRKNVSVHPGGSAAGAPSEEEVSLEKSRYEALVARLLAPLAPAYVDSNLAYLVAAFAGVPPPVTRGPEGPRVDFRLRLPNVPPADTARALATTTAGRFTIGRFLWHWGQLHPLDRVPPAERETAQLLTERFLAQGPMDEDARVQGIDRSLEVERAVERQREAFAGEWYFRTAILSRADTSEAAIRARWEKDPARYHGQSYDAYHALSYPSRAAADSGAALLRGGASWDEALERRFPPGTPADLVEPFRAERASRGASDTLFAWLAGAALGDVFGPREVDGAWWVYRLLEHRVGRQSTYAEARVFVRDELLVEETDRLLPEHLRELRSRYPVRSYTDRLAAIAVDDPFGGAPKATGLQPTGPMMPSLWEKP